MSIHIVSPSRTAWNRAIMSAPYCLVFTSMCYRSIRWQLFQAALGTWFAAASAHADDLIPIEPSARAMRGMLEICDQFATEYYVTFKNTKAQCITFSYSKSGHSASAPLPSFAIGSNATWIYVDRWPHSGYVINAHLRFLARRRSFIGQANSFFYTFPLFDVETRNSGLGFTEPRWPSGNTLASNAEDPGSTPGRRYIKCNHYYYFVR